MVFEYVGFELEHQEQNDPGRGVYRRGVSVNDFEDGNTVGKLHRGGEHFLAPEHIDIEREQCVHKVLKQLKQPVTADTQSMAPAL